MQLVRSYFITITVFLGLLFVLAFERQFGWPVVTLLLGLQVFSQSSDNTRLVMSVLLSLFIASAYMIPLWWGLLVIAAAMQIATLASNKWLLVWRWMCAGLALGLLFGSSLDQFNLTVGVAQVLSIGMVQATVYGARAWWEYHRPLKSSWYMQQGSRSSKRSAAP